MWVVVVVVVLANNAQMDFTFFYFVTGIFFSLNYPAFPVPSLQGSSNLGFNFPKSLIYFECSESLT